MAVLKLRPYQQETIDALYKWFPEHSGNPCVVLPTGSGKSVLLAGFCKQIIKDYPKTRILMCTHQKELIEQDYEKLVSMAPDLDVGIYSAGIGRKEAHNQIVFASIQSVYQHADEVGRINMIIIDECHLINHQDSGMYRTFIEDMKALNEKLRVVGLTATPYRLSHGMITDSPALFNEPLIEPVSIKQLQAWGHLSKLTSKYTAERLDVSKVGVVAGEYNAKQLTQAVDVPGTNEAVVKEVLRRAGDRKSWLFFCCGVDHARHVRDILRAEGISAEMVSGSTKMEERERILKGFKAGEIRAVTNVGVLTTGFDHPGIDLIVMLRPTLSPGLYMQMAGRGLRTAEGKKDCLVLDFAGNVSMHGPITEVKPPKKGARRKGVAPSKVCPQCMEILPLSAKVCPVCGYVYPERERKFQLDTENDIGGEKLTITKQVKLWRWEESTSKAGNPMMVIRYYGKNLTEDPIVEYLLLNGNSWAVARAQGRLLTLARLAGCNRPEHYNADWINMYGKKPSAIRVRKNGKYYEVLSTIFDEGNMELHA